MLDLSEAVEERIKSAFDLSKIGKEVVLKGTHKIAFLIGRVSKRRLMPIFIMMVLCPFGSQNQIRLHRAFYISLVFERSRRA